MQAFLKHLTSYLFQKHGEKLGEYCLLFPNRRSGLFFKNYLRELNLKAFWVPEIYTINDFMEELSEYQPIDPLELSFRVYGIYKEMVKDPESYDEFFYWGEMMLRDFDDIDKYLAEARDIFSNITDLKEIEDHFDYLTQEQKEIISRFWRYFDPQGLSVQKESFLNIWKLLFLVYSRLKESLSREGLAYEGMIYRDVAEKIFAAEYPEVHHEKVIVAGFNALNKAEKALFSHLMKSGKAEFYWDYDQSYIEDPSHEAGRFLRENIKMFPGEEGFQPDRNMLAGGKKIDIYDIPSDVLQTKQLYQILKQRDPAELQLFSDTAVILSDESLLQPVLYSLPSNVPAFNITMGYPLSATPVFSFIDGLLRLQKNLSSRSRKDVFYYRDVLSILNHQYLKSFCGAESQELINSINKLNKIYLDYDFFGENSLFRMIFQKMNSATDMPDYLSDILDIILSLFPEDEKLEKEYIFRIKTRLNKLKELFSLESADQSIESFSRLFRKILSSLRIPFEGEPLQGVQIMGVLESRLLDFNNLIFLSLNEGVMPARHTSFSFIPVNLRYAFGLPTYEEHDAIYAYYFFRLLQRAEHVSILYNSATEGLHTGEPGRYVHQLKYLYHYELEERTVSFRINEKKPVEIRVDKTPEVLEKLKRFMKGGDKYLSPSAITAYIDCPLRFYFSHIAEMGEEDEVSEEIDASGFGTLYHNTLEFLYMEYKGEVITRPLLDKISAEKNIVEKLDEAFRDEFYKSRNKTIEVKPEGRNIIIYEIIKRMVKQTLLRDMDFTDFRFLEAEEKLKVNLSLNGREILLGGKIDRIDERKGKVSLIDYKTGKVTTEFESVDYLFDRDNWKKSENLKGVIQVMMYCWLYREKYGRSDLQPLIYQTNKLFEEEFLPFLQDKDMKSPVENYSDYHDHFDEKLKELLDEIFHPDQPFMQTEDEERCKICSFAGVCHRE